MQDVKFIKCNLSEEIICVCSNVIYYNESFSKTFVELALEKFNNTGRFIITVDDLNQVFEVK